MLLCFIMNNSLLNNTSIKFAKKYTRLAGVNVPSTSNKNIVESFDIADIP